MIKSVSVPVLQKRSGVDNKISRLPNTEIATNNVDDKQNISHEMPSSFIRDVCFASVERDKHTTIKVNDGLSNILAERRRIELKIATRNKFIKGDKVILNALKSAETNLHQLMMENDRLKNKNTKNNQHISHLKIQRDQWRLKFRKEAINRGALFDLSSTKRVLQKETTDARQLAVQATKTSKAMIDAVQFKWKNHKAKLTREIEEYRLRNHAQLLWNAQKIAEKGREGCEFVLCPWKQVVRRQRQDLENMNKKIKKLENVITEKNQMENAELVANLKRGDFKRYPKPSGFDNKPIDTKSLKIPKKKKTDVKVSSNSIQNTRGNKKKSINLIEILSNIYDIYTCKIREDIECDKANIKRVPISKIVLKYYLSKTKTLGDGNKLAKDFLSSIASASSTNNIEIQVFSNLVGLKLGRNKKINAPYTARGGDFLCFLLQRLACYSYMSELSKGLVSITSYKSIDMIAKYVLYKNIGKKNISTDLDNYSDDEDKNNTEHKSLLLIPYRLVYQVYHAVFPESNSNILQSVNKLKLSSERRVSLLHDLQVLFDIPNTSNIYELCREKRGQKEETIENYKQKFKTSNERLNENILERNPSTFLIEMIGKSADIRNFLIDSFCVLDEANTGMVLMNELRSILSTLGVNTRIKDIEDVGMLCDALHDEFLNYNVFIKYCIDKYEELAKAQMFNMKKTGAAIKIQRMVRVVIRKRRFAIHLKETASAILLQSHIRRYLTESKFNVEIKMSKQNNFSVKWKNRRKYDNKRAPLDHVISIFMNYWYEQNAENIKNCSKFYHSIFFPEIEDTTDILNGKDEDTLVAKQNDEFNHNKLLHKNKGGSNPKIKLKAKDHINVKEVDENEDSKNIEEMKIDLDLFIEMIKHCTKNLLKKNEIINIYYQVCEQISKDTTFGIKEWKYVCLHFGITVPINSKTGRIVKIHTSDLMEKLQSPRTLKSH